MNQAVWVRVVAHGNSAPVTAGVVAASAGDGIGIRFPELTVPLPGWAAGCIVGLRVPSDSATHIAETVVIRVQRAPHVMLTVQPPKHYATAPSRKFFRVRATLPVACTIVSSSDPAALGRFERAAKTQNISAGGMSLLTKLPLQIGDELTLCVNVASLRAARTTLELSGRVLRVSLAERKPPMTVSAGIAFVHKEQREQDALMRLMFELQRKSLG